jgi:hypothetical protein
MKSTLYILTLAFTLFSSNVLADCTHSGRSYGEGQQVGPYTCQGGKWVRQ